MTDETIEKFLAMNKSVIIRKSLHERRDDTAFWLKQLPELRFATLERIRREYHDGDQQGFQRVLTISKRP